jgi:L-threonylcarbamoyladenylate synthase
MKRWACTDVPTARQIEEIAATLTSGEVVLLPTDTIYGLHAVATDARAVARVTEIKGRDETKPFIAIASSIDDLARLGVVIEPGVLDALSNIWPAPLTVILPLREPIAASRGLATLAVRIPALDWLRDLAHRTGPLVSTSANRSGEPPIVSPELLARDLQDQLGGIVDGGRREGEPSAILDLSSAEPRLIRAGEHFFTQNLWKTLRKSL